MAETDTLVQGYSSAMHQELQLFLSLWIFSHAHIYYKTVCNRLCTYYYSEHTCQGPDPKIPLDASHAHNRFHTDFLIGASYTVPEIIPNDPVTVINDMLVAWTAEVRGGSQISLCMLPK